MTFSSSEPMSDSSEELAEDSDEEIDSTVARWQGANVDANHKEKQVNEQVFLGFTEMFHSTGR